MDGLDERVGDGDRAGADLRLQRAVGQGRLALSEYEQRVGAVWAAATRAELEAATGDLGDVAPAAADPAQAPPARRVVGVLSGDSLAAPVAPGQPVEAYAVLGSARVDLTGDALPQRVRLRAVAVMGDVDVLVPRGTRVELSGASLMGSRDSSAGPARAGAAIVEVRGYALMGSVHVRSPGPGSGRVDLVKHDRSRAAPLAGGHRDGPHRAGRHRPRRRLLLGAVVAVALAVGLPAVAGADDAAVFGSRVVRLDPGEARDVGVLFGSVKVVVPAGVPVRLRGTVVFGSDQCRAACELPGTTGQNVQVRGRGAFGSIEVVQAGPG